MSKPVVHQEGQSTTRPPYFNGQNYGWWKSMMEIFIQSEDFELWVLIKKGPFTPVKEVLNGEKKSTVPKTMEEYTADDFRKMEKNARAKKLLLYGLGPDEFARVRSCNSAKEIWDSLSVAHEGTSQVKQSRIELLIRQFELFEMSSRETIHDMFTRFTLITNELNSLGKQFTTEDLVRKVLRILPDCWESKVTAITEARDLTTMKLDELIGSLQTHELKKNSHLKNKEKEREKSSENVDMGLRAMIDEDMLKDPEFALMLRDLNRNTRRRKSSRLGREIRSLATNAIS